jgi:methionyl-tRNA synthetase
MKDQITFEEFLELEKKLDIRMGDVLACERIPESKKLLKLTVAFDPSTNDITKTVVTNLGNKFAPEAFVTTRLPFIVNLAPSTICGVVSEAMIAPWENIDGSLAISYNDVARGAKLF